ncbi:hypothetical protein H5410_017839 [Solanum commersonii]|uniref:Uncharacterized protein n=1 Tax=Solanum commersonii TaxID=4109 RepID=A0A9J6A1K2_SOLCO|nr:hypothetical protein H5410_017839 [Solanum commersonii]
MSIFCDTVAIGQQLSSFARLMCYSSQVAAHLDWFGWCTWDAFYKNVNPQGNKEGLAFAKVNRFSDLRRSESLFA